MWRHSERQLEPADFIMASAVAFISSDQNQISSVQKRAEAGLLFCFEFAEDGVECRIEIQPTTEVGWMIADYICDINLSSSPISVRTLA
jgi:hypothetical protein